MSDLSDLPPEDVARVEVTRTYVQGQKSIYLIPRGSMIKFSGEYLFAYRDIDAPVERRASRQLADLQDKVAAADKALADIADREAVIVRQNGSIETYELRLGGLYKDLNDARSSQAAAELRATAAESDAADQKAKQDSLSASLATIREQMVTDLRALEAELADHETVKDDVEIKPMYELLEREIDATKKRITVFFGAEYAAEPV